MVLPVECPHGQAQRLLNAASAGAGGHAAAQQPAFGSSCWLLTERLQHEHQQAEMQHSGTACLPLICHLQKEEQLFTSCGSPLGLILYGRLLGFCVLASVPGG